MLNALYYHVHVLLNFLGHTMLYPSICCFKRNNLEWHNGAEQKLGED